jgi:pantoate--beta-alanine ligase
MLETARRYGKKVGLVPTMGALHEGHLSLVDRSARDCDFTVVSIFVNPLQFGANEDLDKYPRRLREDAALCAERGADFVFAPNSKEMYGDSPQTFVYNPELENIYCGLYRPGHFQGVLTVVAKLFLAVQPTHAYFGKKDYQQAYMIRRMVLDLNFPLQVVSLPTKREKSGLARSSRNEYMSAEERSAAASIYAGLRAAKDAYGSGERRVPALRKMVGSFIGKSGGNVQYIEIASRKALAPQSGVLKVPAVILVACYFGKTRLIDNLEL